VKLHQHHAHAQGHDAGHGVVHVLKVITSILYREVPKPLAFSNCFANCAGRAWRTLKNKGRMLSARRPVKLTEAASVHSLRPLSSSKDNAWFASLCKLRKMGASRSLRVAYVAGLGYGSRIQRMYMVIPHGPLLSKTKRIHMFVVIDLFSSKGS
jgi:hypothetical protein